MAEFLSGLQSLKWEPSSPNLPANVFIGKGSNAVEIAVAQSSQPPSQAILIETWKARKAGRAAPLLLVVLHSTGVDLCGASGEKPPIYKAKDAYQVERFCKEALDQPDRHSALRFLSQSLPSLETNLPGINNQGLLASHELEHGVPKREDWEEGRIKAAQAIGNSDKELLLVLGFNIEPLDNLTSILRGGTRRTALAVMLYRGESPEAGNNRFNSLSPVSYALKKADDENLPWVILVQGNILRIYATAIDAGVGRRGRTETYIECQSSLLLEKHLPYLWLIYSADALEPNGSLEQILKESRRFSGNLAECLRERIYDYVIPELAQGIATAQNIANPTSEDLEHTYEMALTILFRLLFIAYAEDRDLLPYRSNEAYRRRSLKQKAKELADCVANKTEIAKGDSHWEEVVLLWHAVAAGNPEWGVPAYNGGLFSDNSNTPSTNSTLSKIKLPNKTFEIALRHLLVIETPEGIPGPVDFRSLGVREFGTIYEGLLESELALASMDLALDKNGAYVPVHTNNAIAVKKGEVYLHSRSGVRKSSGSYYTKSFVVDHLIKGSLEPALKDHLARLNNMEETDASEKFFDFRVADIAMGSGHFLIGAIDRIEKYMADYLTERNLPGVQVLLTTLRKTALNELGDQKGTADIEDSQLLRRLIARRCIYGVDLNRFSVQLARLAIWIHTFVPGLPLSFLDRNLIHGNTLIGIGTIDDIKRKFEELSLPLFPVNSENLLGHAIKPLKRLANINDATLKDVASSRKLARKIRESLADTEALCDLIVAQSVSDDPKVTDFDFKDWEHCSSCHMEIRRIASKSLEHIHPLHFPVAFPEVFLRERSGFDVILSNPPWQETTIEEHAFWARYFPGLRGLPQREQEAKKTLLRKQRPDLVAMYKAEVTEMKQIRNALMGGKAYPGMGTGDPDLYKAFCWRFWNLTAEKGGYIGVVLPHSAFSAKGSTEFRRTIFMKSAHIDIVSLKNRAKWVFEITPQYTIDLVCAAHGTPTEKTIRLRGPFKSAEEFSDGIGNPANTFECEQILGWNDTASLPLLPSPNSINVFALLRQSPRFDTNKMGGGVARPSRQGNGCHPTEKVHGLQLHSRWWRARPDTELHATTQKKLMSLENKNDFWPVYKGKSFDIWNPDTGIYYAWADPEPVLEWLQRKRLKAAKNHRSPHSEFDLQYLRNFSTLPCLKPRIAFRDVARATDSRTVIACLVPPKIFLGNQAPYLLWPHGDELDQAFLLGVLSSIPLDWYARRFVETHLNYFIINPFPIPRPDRNDVRWKRVVELAGRLACPDIRFAEWAQAVGVVYGQLNDDEKADMIHELDALVAHLYGLSETQLVHIFETHGGFEYQIRLDSVLRHFLIMKAKL